MAHSKTISTLTAFLLTIWFLSTAISMVGASAGIRGAEPSLDSEATATALFPRHLQDGSGTEHEQAPPKKSKKNKKKNKKNKKKKKEKAVGGNTTLPEANSDATNDIAATDDSSAVVNVTTMPNNSTNGTYNSSGTPDLDFFIIGGSTASPNEFPFYSHRFYSNNPAGCGGSLIAQNWVLTAAHCLDTQPIRDGLLPQWRIGSYCHLGDVNNNCGSRFTMTQTVQVFIHPEWNPARLVYDVGLARLDIAVNERPVSLDDGSVFNKLEEGDPIKSIGMGYVNDQFEFADYLQEVTNFFFPPERCYSDRPSIMCTNGRDVGTCRGDSGSPNLYWDGGQWKQVGITSFGRAQCENHDSPDGLARVATAHSWIAKTVCANVYGTVPDFCDPSDVKQPPTTQPTPTPTRDPTQQPTQEPTRNPTMAPTNQPTLAPTQEPTSFPTQEPSNLPTSEPTNDPTLDPTSAPTFYPTLEPTNEPTLSPLTAEGRRRTREPSREPTRDPTLKPSREPTRDPTFEPSRHPTLQPSPQPTRHPTFPPSRNPTPSPSRDPTPSPSQNPTFHPTRPTSPVTTTNSPVASGASGILGGFGRFGCQDLPDFEYEDEKRLCSIIEDRNRAFYCSFRSNALRNCPMACGNAPRSCFP